ncbi:expressed unknown protein [Seminavis robusta]|uniref:Uncharacterized protein n=1 Tax=Seminavis robusta TaxID=568900 RepID=A0A9N8HFM8_9STRA|nr:expressed unknown protein [Seminavis robusta]|eukprot:Sro581_g170340.1 n/a (234) ;mRNA; r:41036-41737
MTDSNNTVDATVQNEPLTPESTDNENVSVSNTKSLTKASLRKLMVSCIDSALEELGPIADISEEQLKKKTAELPSVLPDLTCTNKAPKVEANSAPSSSAAADLYGYGPSSPEPQKAFPDLEVRGRRSRPRYQRRNSVTKFSLCNALQQVQKEDREGNLKVHQQQPPAMNMLMMKRRMPVMGGGLTPSRQLWQHLYAKIDERPMKRTALALGTPMPSLTPVELPAAKRRRGSAA